VVPSSHRAGPLLVDAHVHIKTPEGITSIVTAGITAVRDAGMKGRTWQDTDGNRSPSGHPIILSAEWALYQKGGYGSLLGAGVDTRDEIKSEILKLKDSGAGIIKVIASGLVSLLEPGLVTRGGFNREKLAFIVREARKLDLHVMAHANGISAIRASVEAGVRSIEHGFFMTMPVLEEMAKREIFWTPTVGALVRAADSPKISTGMKRSLAELIDGNIRMIGKAHGIGVPLAVGTDCVLPDPHYEKKYKAELTYFEQAGISHGDTLKIAGEGGSELLEIE